MSLTMLYTKYRDIPGQAGRIQLAPGNVWFVDSGVDGTSGLTPEDAFGTLAEAVSAATANNGDIIYLMPGHAESIAAAAGVDITKAGLNIIGLGLGGDRPTFTFITAAGATFAIGASSTYIENVLFVANFTNGITAGVDIDDNHSDITLKNCEWRASAATKEFLKAITIAENAGRVTVDGCKFYEAAGDATCAIFTESTATNITIKNCEFWGTYTTSVLDLDDDAITVGLRIWNNIAYNSDTGAGLFATVTAATVGLFVGNRSGIGKGNTIPVTDGTASVFVDNLATDAANISELKYPATATAWS